MNVQAVPYMPPTTSIPGKIQAAMEFLRYCQGLETGPVGYSGETWKDDAGRQLTRKEQAVYNAALDALSDYFRDPSDVDDASSMGFAGGDDYSQPVSIIA